MSPLNLNLVRKLTVGNAQWKVSKCNGEITLLCGLCSLYYLKSGFLRTLIEGALQGGYIKMIFNTFSICSFGLFDYFITPPCNDPMKLFLLDIFGHVNDYKTLGTFYRVDTSLFLHCWGLNI